MNRFQVWLTFPDAECTITSLCVRGGNTWLKCKMERDWGKEGKELGDKGEGIYKLYNIVRQIDREEKNYLKKK